MGGVSGALILACAGGVRVTGIRVVLVASVSPPLSALLIPLLIKAPLEAAQRAVMECRIVLRCDDGAHCSVHSRSCGDRAGSCVARVRSLCCDGDDGDSLGGAGTRVRIAVIAAAMVLFP